MTSHSPASPTALDETTRLLADGVRRLSVAEYHQMIDAHILGEDDRVELLEGLLVTMSPQRPPHAVVIERLCDSEFVPLDRAFRIRCQLPLTLEDSEPEPDVVVLPRSVRSDREHPRTAPLVFEVSGESLARDRIVKSRLYARARIAEYVIVDVEARELEVFRDPAPEHGRYDRVIRLGRDHRFASETVSGFGFVVGALFGEGE